MPLSPPAYFEEVRTLARKRWDQLEADPELAGPWRLLFQQVQSPRHVVSELLQNADDAGASWVRISTENGWFVFEHNGSDFTAIEFASLCKFGFSNKRNLHTIGFRGIGFKSTFSLGVAVEVASPTLAVRFHSGRFTEPLWIDNASALDRTRIRVPLHFNESVRTELKRSLDEWRNSCSSLLFFRNIRQLDINGVSVRREIIGPGPVPRSHYVRLSSQLKQRLLVIRSEAEEFPPEAVAEIKQERNSNELVLPPCEIELVLGIEGDQRLFVVLPTGVRPPLPFSCNAPFIQDPARLRIKDPALSPTNQWLLRRLGVLAAQLMVTWVSNASLSIEVRAEAYCLLPATAPPSVPTDENLAAETATEAFSKTLGEQRCVLTSEGTLTPRGKSMALPRELHAVWPTSALSSIFSPVSEKTVATQVADSARHRLSSWNLVRQVNTDEVYRLLTTRDHVPRPTDLSRLVTLWAFLESECRYRHSAESRRLLKIVPVEGTKALWPAERVVRLTSRAALPSNEDWQFLAKLVTVVDSRWISHLARGQSEVDADPSIANANSVLQLLGLGDATAIAKVIADVAANLFASGNVTIADSVRLTHIAAATGAEVPCQFQYAALDGVFRLCSHGIVLDPHGSVEELVPPKWAQQHILHSDYLRGSPTCPVSTLLEWAASEKSQLSTLPRIQRQTRLCWGEHQLERFLASRGSEPPTAYHYRGRDTQITDYDFEKGLVAAWEERAADELEVWSKLALLILEAPPHIWQKLTVGTVHEKATNGNLRKADCPDFPAAWVHRLTSKACLPDTFGQLHEPAELLMRTPDTEPLMGVELFIKAELDTPQTRPLLKLLGVRDTPSGPHQLINRIKQLATVARPPVQEVVRWYDALDRVLVRARPVDLSQVQAVFKYERLILTQDMEWVKSPEVFLCQDDENVPGVATVHEAARNLSLWRRVNIDERPSPERILAWLRGLQSGQRIEGSELRRIKGILQRLPHQVWEQCQHWLTLEGTWALTDSLRYRLTMQALTRYADLFPTFKAQTADLRNLDAVTCEQLPFSQLLPLDAAIEYRVTDRNLGGKSAQSQPWLSTFGQLLQRVKLDDDKSTQRAHELGLRMSQTEWQPVRGLKVSPYIDGTPAGQPASADALWHESTLYVQDRPISQLFNSIVHELSRLFASVQISDAIRTCIGRDSDFIADYFAENFQLEEIRPLLPPEASKPPIEDVIDEPPEAPEEINLQETDQAGAEAVSPTDTGEPQPDDALEAPLPPDAEEEFEISRAPRPKSASLFDRFAAAEGFKLDVQRGKYVHPQGDWLVRRTSGFNCERFTEAGELVCQYWVSDQSLSNGGVEINADLWELMQAQSLVSAVVLNGPNERPCVIHANDLMGRVQRREILLFPAKYRLRQDDG